SSSRFHGSSCRKSMRSWLLAVNRIRIGSTDGSVYHPAISRERFPSQVFLDPDRWGITSSLVQRGCSSGP
ncbi:MAG: hypothetical protein ACK53L_35815, partial [Pirellulaceae bacterium]